MLFFVFLPRIVLVPFSCFSYVFLLLRPLLFSHRPSRFFLLTLFCPSVVSWQTLRGRLPTTVFTAIYFSFWNIFTSKYFLLSSLCRFHYIPANTSIQLFWSVCVLFSSSNKTLFFTPLLITCMKIQNPKKISWNTKRIPHRSGQLFPWRQIRHKGTHNEDEVFGSTCKGTREQLGTSINWCEALVVSLFLCKTQTRITKQRRHVPTHSSVTS